jgi:hypothetical protein
MQNTHFLSRKMENFYSIFEMLRKTAFFGLNSRVEGNSVISKNFFFKHFLNDNIHPAVGIL